MPARKVLRCRPRSTVDLDLLDELNCVEWVPILPGTQFKTFAAMRSVWNRWGEKILAHYVGQRPGTRPFALWALGELPLPELKHQPNDHSLKTTIEGRVFYSPWWYFGTRTGEGGYYLGGSAWGQFQYLRGLGVIDDAEAALAEKWVDDRNPGKHRERRDYKPLASMTGADSP